MKEEVLQMGFEEDEFKEILDAHKQILDTHEDKLQKLEIEGAIIKEKMNSIEDQMSDVKEAVTRFENNYLQNTNSMMSTMTQLVLNTSSNKVELEKIDKENIAEITKVKSNNVTQVILKILAVISAVAVGFITAFFSM